MNSAEKPHCDADSSVSSVLRRYPVFGISKPFLSKFITASREALRIFEETLAEEGISTELVSVAIGLDGRSGYPGGPTILVDGEGLFIR